MSCLSEASTEGYPGAGAVGGSLVPDPQGQESYRGLLSPPTAAEPQEDLPGEPPGPRGIEGSPGEVAGMMRRCFGERPLIRPTGREGAMGAAHGF